MRRPFTILLHLLILLALSACGITTANPSLPAAPVPQPTSQTPGGGQPPAVLQVVEREEVIDGSLYVYDDIYFTDPDGDADVVTYNLDGVETRGAWDRIRSLYFSRKPVTVPGLPSYVPHYRYAASALLTDGVRSTGTMSTSGQRC